MAEAKRGWLAQRSMAQKVGMVFAGLGLVLALVGIARGSVPLNPLSIFLALLISGGTWGVVSWAIAAAVADVEHDIESTEPTHAEGVSADSLENKD